jgi:hypothetical protein
MKKVLASAALVLAPGIALAQSSTYIDTYLGYIIKLVNAAVPLLITIAIIVFFWGVISYVVKSDPEGKEAARHTMIYGIIGIAVMVSVWGLVRILRETVGATDNNPNVPTLPNIPR